MLCLMANADKVYQLGIGQVVSLCSIARANETRYFKEQQDNQLKFFDL
jgi:hypothetical protein